MPNRAERRAQVKATGRPAYLEDVAVGYLHPNGEVSSAFTRSLVGLQAYDLKGATTPDGHHMGGHGRFAYHMPLESGANIVTARNKIVYQFLTGTQADWLWMIDADMEFHPATLDMLLASAHPKDRPIVGGLCFARIKGEAQAIVPTVYSFNSQGQMVRWNGYPEDQLFQVGGTGAACLLVHRTVFQAMLDSEADEEWSRVTGVPVGTKRFPPPWPWFAETITGTGWGDSMSEDLTFCFRAGMCGFPIFVDSRIKIGHQKPVVIDEAMYRSALPPKEEPAPTYVIIPVKGKTEFTDSIVDQLAAQGGYDHIFIYDNAQGTDDQWAGTPDPEYVTVLMADGLNIHEMWNLGIKEALNRDPRCNIAILNNDLEFGPNFLEELAKGLRVAPDIAAVCANYDRRKMVELVQAVKGVAAGREDGTGGFAGFAMMFRGELFAEGILPPFDESLHLWWGDTLMCLVMDRLGLTYGIVRDATCVHIGGGSQTSGDGNGHRLTPDLQKLVNADQKRFEQIVAAL